MHYDRQDRGMNGVTVETGSIQVLEDVLGIISCRTQVDRDMRPRVRGWCVVRQSRAS